MYVHVRVKVECSNYSAESRAFQIYDVACRRVNELNNAKIFRDGGVDYSKSNLRDLVKNSFERITIENLANISCTCSC